MTKIKKVWNPSVVYNGTDFWGGRQHSNDYPNVRSPEFSFRALFWKLGCVCVCVCVCVVVLGFELVRSRSTTRAPPSFLFAFGYFSGRILLFAESSLERFFPCSQKHRGAPQHLVCLLRWGSLTFCLGWPQTTFLQISASQEPGIRDVSHHTPPEDSS
jgi:hypothetical protein